MSTTTPKPDTAAILSALGAMFSPDDVIELRAIHKGGRKRTDAGYFDSAHWPALADHAAQLSNNGAAVYVTLNPVDAQLLGRYSNRIEAFATATTTDKQIIRRRWLLIDLDPVRPAQTSATDTQLEAAHVKAGAIYKHLKGIGWAEPVVAKSGNGYHLIYAIDLPNDDDATALLKGALAALADRFDDAQIKVDRSVFNAARICKLYGTVANKGDNTEAAPWRLSTLVSTPARELVTVDQLRMMQPIPTATATPKAQTRTTQQGTFNLEDFLSRHGLDYSTDRHDGRERFKLKACPFNSEHVNGDAAVFRDNAGKLGFHCMHDSCSGNTWQSLRDLLDGPRQQRAPQWDYDGIDPGIDTGAGQAGPDTWEPPIEIVSGLPPAPQFEANVLLPKALADFVLDEADRMPCSPDYIAASLIVCLGSVIGATCGLKPKRRDDWIVTPNLWGGIVGDPSSKKSPALSTTTRFIDRLEAREADKLVESKKVFEAEKAAHEAYMSVAKDTMKKAAKGKPDALQMASAISDMSAITEPEEPHARRYKTNDASVEKLCDIEVKNPQGLMIFRDELVGLLASWEREGHEGDRAFYLEGWNGTGSYNSDRIGRGEQFVKNHCLSILGGIQPDKLETYLSDIASSLDNDGRIQRFQIMVYPNPVPWEWRDRYPVKGAREAVRDMFDRLSVFDPVQDGATPADDFVKLPHFYFDNAAQEIFIEWCHDLNLNQIVKEQDPLMKQHLGKYEKLFCSLALILHLAEGNIGNVKADSALRAAAWCDYLAGHARRVYGMVEGAKVATANMLLRRIREGKLQSGFTLRDVRRKQWSGATDTMQVEAVLAMLEAHHCIHGSESVNGGRPTTTYEVNPALIGSKK